MKASALSHWVMFGTHPLFGDYADAIHARGGILSRVVRNADEPPRPPGHAFEDRLARYHDWLDRRGVRHRVGVLALEDFMPGEGESYLFGFRGPKLLPLRDVLKRKFQLRFNPLIHPTACVSPACEVEEGAFVGAACKIGPNVRIGEFTFVNRGVIIEHDSEAHPCAIIGPGAAVASSVRIGHGAVLGINAVVLEKLSIGEGSYVAGGAVVIRDVPPHVMVAGVPALEKKSWLRE